MFYCMSISNTELLTRLQFYNSSKQYSKYLAGFYRLIHSLDFCLLYYSGWTHTAHTRVSAILMIYRATLHKIVIYLRSPLSNNGLFNHSSKQTMAYEYRGKDFPPVAASSFMMLYRYICDLV